MAGGGDAGPTLSQSPLAAQFETLLPRRSVAAEATFDITAMIDLVFMMNIFFLVTTLTGALMQLPPARNCRPTDANECVVVNVRVGAQPDAPLVAFGEDEAAGTTDAEAQVEQLREAIDAGQKSNPKKKKVLIKAEPKVRLKDIIRLSSVVSGVEGMELVLGVTEVDRKE